MSSHPIELALRDDAIARALAAGFDRDRICLVYNVTPAAVERLEADASFRSRIDHYKERRRVFMEMQEHYAEACSLKAWQSVETILDSPQHREHGQTARWVLDKTLPQRQAQEGGLQLHIGTDTMRALVEALRSVRASRDEHSVSVTAFEDHLLSHDAGSNGGS